MNGSATKLCPDCSQLAPADAIACERCGHDFTEGSTAATEDIGAGGATTERLPPVLAEGGSPVEATPVARGILVFLALLVAGAGGVWALTSAADDPAPAPRQAQPSRDGDNGRGDGGKPGRDKRDRSGNKRPGGAGGTRGARQCTKTILGYLEDALARSGRGRPDKPPAEVLKDAATRFGAESFEFTTLVRAYGPGGLLADAIENGTDSALRKGAILVARRCARRD